MIGTTVGPYIVVSKLGEGGMGEVYRARDSRLKRDVAIKVLPADVANDRERLARFHREAEVLAALNHPCIAHVYGIEDSALVMELIDGEDLSQRISRGPVPVDEALPLAKQIAEALEAAHEAGIIHRDLKPANIKVRDDGTIKVLDFGLAKALDGAGKAGGAGGAGQDEVLNSPTITSPAMTAAGIILGTAAYMAPEQAKGKNVDRRADVWAFGCVLYEMLTGRRAFQGDDVTDIITSVMRDTPDWQALPAGTPQSIRQLLRRCLDKDPRKRAPHMSIARLAIDDASNTSSDLVAPVAPSAPRSAWRLALMTGLMAAAAAAALTLTLTPSNIPASRADGVFRYSIAVPFRGSSAGVSVSPDGRYVALAGRDKTGNRQIWLRAFDGPDFAMLDGATDGDFPFWSPDSREIAFFSNRRLRRIAVQGGSAREIANVETLFANTTVDGSAATWGADGTILFGRDRMYRVAADGGPIEPALGGATPSAPDSWGGLSWPQWLSGQGGFLFTKISLGVRSEGAHLYQPLPDGVATTLIESRARAHVTAGGVLVARAVLAGATDLRVHQFDAATGRLDQPGQVLAADASLDFSASSNGVLVYRSGSAGAPYRFEWVDASGRTAGESFDTIEPGPFNLSMDDTLLAFMETGNLVVRDLSRGVSTTLVQGRGVEPILSPDGRRLAYSLIGNQRPSIVIQPSSGGAAETVYESSLSTLTEDWSSDGKYLAVNEGGRRGLIITVDNAQPPITYAEFPAGGGLDEPRFSPDGRWLVYNAAPAATQEVFLIPLPPTGERWQVSLSGGSQGRWRRDGRAVYYMAANGELMAVDVQLTPGARPILGRPRVLFNTGLTPTTNIDQYAPNRDGTRFLLRRPRGNDGLDRLEVIVNWPALLNRP